MHRYTKDMPLHQRAARHALDIASHVFCCHGRHQARVAHRIAHGLPPLHADKLALDQAQEARRKPLEQVISTALLAHDSAMAQAEGGEVDALALQALAQAAMRRLADQGLVPDEAVQVFCDAEPRYVDSWRDPSPAALPRSPHLLPTLCRAAIGQACIDEGIVAPEGAQVRAPITQEAVEAWFYF